MLGINGTIDVLTQDEKELIHEKSLRILQEIGLHAPCREFLKLMEEHGATIDYEREIMYLSRSVIEPILAKGREEHKLSLKLQPITGNVSTEVYLVDYLTRSRRLGTTDDVMKGIALLNRLSAFPSANAVVVPSDVPSGATDIVSFQKILSYSKKPGGTYILTPESAEFILQLADAANHPVSYDFQTISPLRFSSETLKMAMCFYRHGKPSGCGPFVMSMGSGPITAAGSLLVQNAEFLACMFVTYVLSGRINSYNETIHPMDPSTLVCSFGAPGISISAFGGCSMAKFYGLTSGGNVGLTDALDPDFQSGFEKGVSAAFAALSGGKWVGGQGIVGADQGISLEQLVIDNDWIEAFNFSIRGIDVSEETLAEDLIHELGIGATFIQEEHTIEHLRECHWQPSVFYRGLWEDHSKSLLERAVEKVELYTKGYDKMEPVVSDSTYRVLEEIASDGIRAALH